ncbi:SiaB family protein kinase [Sediminibacterium sp.]|uniref:SiaB family protein kinase n=1 Tax=Sediminibacterium sp. TaxID=1917865 RepID=UPI002736474A|nr:SiaB family protein kinase [Sediminibacterium sp.]MDP3567301.1 SiaB family protein kinase [Sediminibacterium sp.]
MSLTLNKESEFFDLQFTKQVKKITQSGQLILAYDGVLNNETISKIENEIENKILEKGFPKQVVKKVFFICVESLQNQLLHGHKDDKGSQHNFFLLANSEKYVTIISANLINTSSVEKVKSQIEKINSFDDPAALKAFYLEHLENNELSDKGGAGLGFITIAMKSGNKITPLFETINEKYSLFLLEIKINLE